MHSEGTTNSAKYRPNIPSVVPRPSDGTGRRNHHALTLAVLSALLLIAARPAQAQTETVLYNFCSQPNCSDGAVPGGTLVQGLDGNLYGATDSLSGPIYYPTVFNIAPSGTLTTIYTFPFEQDVTVGSSYGLVLGRDGNFYGAGNTSGNDYGSVFSITAGGTLTTLHLFEPVEGKVPPHCSPSALTLGTDNNFYGTTNDYGCGHLGSVFKITPGGVITFLHMFVGTDGSYPSAPPIEGTDGNFYGTTGAGHSVTSNAGTIYRVTPAGTFALLASFDSDKVGANPEAALVQATNGNFYGATTGGGTNNCGTIFKVTTSGELTTLYNFGPNSDCTDGFQPAAPLVQGTDGKLYGTASGGGANGSGTLFRISTSGTFTSLYSFCSQVNNGVCKDGSIPSGGLAQDTDGTFYGVTSYGGTSSASCPYIGVLDFTGCGTFFSLSVGLGTFVETLPTSGAVGAAVSILGTNLTGATNVTFNGTPATFRVDSSTEITTTVPAGATTGKVVVQFRPAHYVFTSNVNFRVTPVTP
jgi:uncharacterized repeat protein (TIGR03803 family)